MKRAILVLGGILGGCTSAPSTPPSVEVLEATQARVSAGHQAAVDSSRSLGEYDVQLRYNPARCDCPKYEIQAYGRWVRVYLVGPTAQLTAVERFAADLQTTPRRAQMQVRARLLDNDRKSSRGVAYPVFELVAP